jgi:hypothetical protein
VRLEASTKPHVHQKIEIFWTNIASSMTCPNFKKWPKNGLCPLGVNNIEGTAILPKTSGEFLGNINENTVVNNCPQ